MASQLLHGLTSLGNANAILYLAIGICLGVVVGVIPGLSTIVILSIILLFSYHISLVGTLCLFLGAQTGSYYSASITSILLNAPAHPEAFAITFDGYPMARKGQAGRALGLSAGSTAVGGIIGCAIFLAFIPFMNDLAGFFKPAAYVALVVFAMTLVGTLGTNSVGKAITSAGAGFLIASIGPSLLTGQYRYTFGANGLDSGISLVALALGVFAIPQMVMIFGTASAVARQDMTGREIGSSAPVQLTKGMGKEVLRGIAEVFHHWRTLIQSGIVGGLTGIIPGIGGFAGNFLAYGIARQTSRQRDQFGTGTPEGIIAPEGSSLSKEAGHMIPLLGLGIPGGVGGALFLAAIAIKNINVGYGFTQVHPTMPYEIIWILIISGIVGTGIGVLLGPVLAKITRVPGPMLVPFVFSLCVVGPFIVDTQFFSVVEVVIFGLIGLSLRRLQYPLGSFVLGLVLGPTFESNISLTRNTTKGWGFLTQSPLADVLVVITILVIIAKAFEVRRSSQREKVRLAEMVSSTNGVSERETDRLMNKIFAPYPLLAVIMSAVLLAVSLYAVVYGTTHYLETTWLMPAFGGLLVAIPAAISLPKDIVRYVQYRQLNRGVADTTVVLDPALAVAGAPTEGVIPSLSTIASTAPSSVSTEQNPTVIDKSWAKSGQYRREVVAIALVCVTVGLSWFFGFLTGITIFMVGYGLFGTARFIHTYRARFAFAILSAAAMWLTIHEIFHLDGLLYTPKIVF